MANLIGQFDLLCLHTHIVRQLLIPSSLPAPPKKVIITSMLPTVFQITEAVKAQEKLGFDYNQPI